MKKREHNIYKILNEVDSTEFINKYEEISKNKVEEKRHNELLEKKIFSAIETEIKSIGVVEKQSEKGSNVLSSNDMKATKLQEKISSSETGEETKKISARGIGKKSEKISSRKRKTVRIKRLAGIAAALVVLVGVSFFDQIYSATMMARDQVAPNLVLPFERSDYRLIGKYIVVPEKNKFKMGDRNITIKGMVLDGDTLYVSTTMDSEKDDPYIENNVYVNGKPATMFSGSGYLDEKTMSYTSTYLYKIPKNIDSRGSMNIIIKSYEYSNDRTKYNGSVSFDAKFNNISETSTILYPSEKKMVKNVEVDLRKISINTFSAEVEADFKIPLNLSDKFNNNVASGEIDPNILLDIDMYFSNGKRGEDLHNSSGEISPISRDKNFNTYRCKSYFYLGDFSNGNIGENISLDDIRDDLENSTLNMKVRLEYDDEKSGKVEQIFDESNKPITYNLIDLK